MLKTTINFPPDGKVKKVPKIGIFGHARPIFREIYKKWLTEPHNGLKMTALVDLVGTEIIFK